jgi:excisionase family DNA binding protein
VTVELRIDDETLDRLADAVADRLASRRPADAEHWVGVERAAEHLACKPQRIYNLVHDRAIPHRKDGGRLLFRLSELDATLSSNGEP